jgi:hypothetical protein
LTGLTFVVAEGSVEGCEHSELILFQFVLGFGGGSSRLNDPFNRSNRSGNLPPLVTYIQDKGCGRVPSLQNRR